MGLSGPGTGIISPTPLKYIGTDFIKTPDRDDSPVSNGSAGMGRKKDFHHVFRERRLMKGFFKIVHEMGAFETDQPLDLFSTGVFKKHVFLGKSGVL
jgi:hypothetical protein